MNASDLIIESSILRSPAGVSKAKELFSQFGAVIFQNAVSDQYIEQFLLTFRTMISAALELRGVRFGKDLTLDEIYAQYCESDPVCAKKLKGLGKDLKEFFAFFSLPGVVEAAESLFGHCHFQINYDQCLFRIDRPDEDQHAFDWHQDFPYNMMSENALTVWAPLAPVTKDMGFLKIIPGSHKHVYPVQLNLQSSQGGFNTHNAIEIADLSAHRDRFEAEAIEVNCVKPGDMLCFHGGLLHRSGQNRSNKCRWVVNPRIGDLLAKDVVKRDWISARAKNPYAVREIRPDLVARVLN